MSATPRTDEATYPADCLGKTLVVNRNCAAALETELTSMSIIAEKWEADSLRYAKNAEYWQSRTEKAEAALATERKKVVDEITEKNAPEIAKVNAHIADMTARAEKAEAELAAESEKVKVMREALECMLVGACAVGVPHKAEKQVLQDAVDIARDALAATKEASK